jgi:hypothetical protein
MGRRNKKGTPMRNPVIPRPLKGSDFIYKPLEAPNVVAKRIAGMEIFLLLNNLRPSASC